MYSVVRNVYFCLIFARHWAPSVSNKLPAARKIVKRVYIRKDERPAQDGKQNNENNRKNNHRDKKDKKNDEQPAVRDA